MSLLSTLTYVITIECFENIVTTFSRLVAKDIEVTLLIVYVEDTLSVEC